jgi:hypothetical protein
VRARPAAFRAVSVRLSTTTVDVLVSLVVVAVVSAPLLRTNAPLDLVNHLWVSWAGGKALAQAGHPSYFINTTTQGVFNPWFAFYGGTLYMATGALSQLSGHPYVAFAAVTVAAIAATYVGTLVFGRQFGLRGLLAHAPALAVVTSAYYITDLYGRGAWTEFIALSAIAPLAASMIILIRAPNWRPLPVFCFVVSAVVLTGSHNLTLLWSVTIAVAALLVIWIGLGRPSRLPYRRMAMVAGLGLLAVLVNGWFLFTDVVYARDVVTSTTSTDPTGAVAAFDAASVLFDPFRTWPSSSAFPSIYVQVPEWFLGWGLAAGAALLWQPRASKSLRRVWISVVIVVAVLLALILDNSIWTHIPFPFNQIQFPFRLNGFLLFAVAAVVLLGALALEPAAPAERRRRTLAKFRIALLAVAAMSAVLCVWQEWVPSTTVAGYFVSRDAAFVGANVLPVSFYAVDPYADISAPIVPVPAGRNLTIDPAEVQGDRFAGRVAAPPGMAPIQTNIAGGDYVVHISGLRWLGRNPTGFAVVQRLKNGRGQVNIVVSTAHTAAFVAGSILSIVALVMLLAILIYTAVRPRLRRRATVDPPAASA